MDEKKVYNLIIGYLQNQLTEEEIASFHVWVQASKENKSLYFELKSVYDATSLSGKVIDVDAQWKSFVAKRTYRVSYHLFKQVASYAAIVMIAVTLTTLYFISDKSIPQVGVQYITGNGVEANRVILSDGTVVSIAAQTRIYPAVDYGKKTRTLHLEGEAYFEVAKDASKPFIVQTKKQAIQALGTAFNVMAYPSDSKIITTLTSGIVQITTEGISDAIRLYPNEQLIYDINSKQLIKSEVDAVESSAWKAGYYHFNEEYLVSILTKLGNVYGVDFRVETHRLDKSKFTGTFYRGQSLKELMEIINLSVPIEYTIRERDIEIR